MIRNSCPVCRHELPTDTETIAAAPVESTTVAAVAVQNGSENIGLTIWRLSGSGFAVGSFLGREGELGSESFRWCIRKWMVGLTMALR